MNARQYFQIYRAIMPLLAASPLVACGIDLESYGEPFFKLARDAGAQDAAADQPADTAGRSAAGSAAPVQNAAVGGGRASDDVEGSEDAGVGEDASVPYPVGGAGGHTAGGGGVGGAAGSGDGGKGGTGGNTSGGAGGGTSAAVSFSDLYTGIIATGCSCHNSGAGGLDLSTRNLAYASLVSVPSTSCFGEQRVVPGDAEASVLFHSLSHTSMIFCEVPTMPRGSGQLSAAQLAQLEAWINDGARDD
jgi:hypothetical protein